MNFGCIVCTAYQALNGGSFSIVHLANAIYASCLILRLLGLKKRFASCGASESDEDEDHFQFADSLLVGLMAAFLHAPDDCFCSQRPAASFSG